MPFAVFPTPYTLPPRPPPMVTRPVLSVLSQSSVARGKNKAVSDTSIKRKHPYLEKTREFSLSKIEQQNKVYVRM